MPTEKDENGRQAVFTVGESREESIRIEDSPKPEIGPTEVLVHNRFAGVNFAQIEQRRGVYEGIGYRDWEPPLITGHECSGIVEEVGREVDSWSEGDRVLISTLEGGLREYFTFDTEKVLGEGDGTEITLAFDLRSDTDLAEVLPFAIQGLTAYGCLNVWSDITAEDNVLLHAAAGGVGSMAVQLADKIGATSFGTASTEEKLSYATELGLDYPIQYTEEDTVEQVRDVLGTDDGIDLTIDGVGGSAFKESVELTDRFGDIIVLGVASGRPGIVSTPKLIFQNVSVKGQHLWNSLAYSDTQRFERGMDELLEMYYQDEIVSHIDEVFSIDDLVEAHEYVAERNSIGKVAIEFD